MSKEFISDISNDPMGQAIYDYHRKGNADTLLVHSSMFEDDEIPVETLFRDYNDMPEIERVALELSSGRICDVGAAAGCHSIALRNMGKSSVAIDMSVLSVDVMKERGIDARLVNFYDTSFEETFDTVLMLMNGTGIIGNLDNIANFFTRLKQILKPGGCLLIDSSDLRYLFEEEDGSLMIDLADEYYGQVDFQMQYKDDLGESFDWLYLDFNTLAYYAEENGFKAEVIAEGEYYDYLARVFLAD
jgi:SAM-dependent methyltransferase